MVDPTTPPPTTTTTDTQEPTPEAVAELAKQIYEDSFVANTPTHPGPQCPGLVVSSYNHVHVHFCLLLQKASPTEIRPTAEPLCLIFDFPEP